MSEALALASTVDLENELMSRFDHAIFHGLKLRPTEDFPRNHIKSWKYKGDLYICQGLGFEIVARCHEAIAEAEEEIDPNDL